MSRFICIGESKFKISGLCNLSAEKRDRTLLSIFRLLNENDHHSTRCESCGTKSYGSRHCILCRLNLWKSRNPVIIRKNLHFLQGGACCYCGKQLALGKSTIEHIDPKSKKGEDSFYNYTLACHDCNVRRGNDDFEPFMKQPCSHRVGFGEPTRPFLIKVTKQSDKVEKTPEQCIKSILESLDITRVALEKHQKKVLSEDKVQSLLRQHKLTADDVASTNLSKYKKHQRKAIMVLQESRSSKTKLERVMYHRNRLIDILENRYGVVAA